MEKRSEQHNACLSIASYPIQVSNFIARNESQRESAFFIDATLWTHFCRIFENINFLFFKRVKKFKMKCAYET